MPRLIIENNIHGVDIDPRATQIAGLSLWLRAHNSWQQAGIKPQNRPKIQRSNIVCAEPMPGEKALLQEFTASLKPTVLGQLVEIIFEKMELAGEAGTLLKIEQEIQDAIAEAKQVWQQQNQALSHFPDLAKIAKQRGEIEFDVSDINDEGFWEQAEQKILAALADYAQSATTDESGQRRLFAEDAAKGFAFIELCRKRFDVVLMNPPFGDSSKGTKRYIDDTYLRLKNNLLACFIERGHELITDSSMVGAIVSRTGFYLSSLSEFRKHTLLDESKIECHIDLGSKVLDAMVEVACTVFSKRKANNNQIPFIRLLTDSEKEQTLRLQLNEIGAGRAGVKTFIVNQRQLVLIDGSIVYWISFKVAEKLSAYEKIEPYYADIRVGLQTGADFRFLGCGGRFLQTLLHMLKKSSSHLCAEMNISGC